MWSITFFITMILAVAFFPIIFYHWWEKNTNKLIVSLILAFPVVWYFLKNIGFSEAIVHTMEEYIAFVVLLGALYIISGGIHLKGDIQATPKTNTLFLGIGAILSNLIGTTGASMLLIRPLINTNSERDYKMHTIIFFIFLVSNIGGSLLPIGDPPLFLGFLKGVPFFWTLKLFPIWIVTVAILLTIYYFWDRYIYTKKEKTEELLIDAVEQEKLQIEGKWNFFLLLLVVLSVIFLNNEYFPNLPMFSREIVMTLLTIISLVMTPKNIRKENHFSFYPILEVAAVFIGIFLTMIPVIMILKAKGATIHLTKPWEYFWLTGSLSSFLDNAPTYLTFFSLAQGITLHLGISTNIVANIYEPLLKGVSTGAVFMGAMTYIGNAPNFMVRSISEASKIKMPSFFGYMKYSIGILVPVFILINVIFLL